MIWASHTGFQGCLTSARNAAAVLGGEAFAYEPGAGWPDCDLLVLSSWHRDYVLPEGPRIVVRWHSTLLQTELSGDLPKLEHILDLGVPLACCDRDTAEALGATWLPDVLDEAEYAGIRPAALDGVNVVLPGEPYPRKNLLVQIAAFERARAGRDWTLHLLGQTVRRPELAAWLARHDVPCVDHGFLDRAAYRRLVAGADAGLAASLTEAWGYAAGDFVALGVPVVVSPAVVSVTEPVADPESVTSVADALVEALVGGAPLAARARDGMRVRAAGNREVARAALARLADG